MIQREARNNVDKYRDVRRRVKRKMKKRDGIRKIFQELEELKEQNVIRLSLIHI